ncbi:MAG TPA: c-type cytochrome [Bryobacteraceae bacterium]|jgi:mono/diheme cytochrome c family protein
MSRLWLLGFVVTASVWGQAGPTRPDVDSAAADRGKRIYLQYCVNCHGSQAKGTDQGPDLIRSVPVLHDEVGAALKKVANHKSDLTLAQVRDLSAFLKQRVEETVKNRNAVKPPNVLTGNAAAGKAYFEGAGKCGGCHSATGNLAGIAKKYDPLTLQQRLLFPRSGGRGAPPVRPTVVTVTLPAGAVVSGNLDRIDDFTVSLKDAAGEYRSYTRIPAIKVELRDPYAAHNEMLDQYTDADIHNLVAYLETLK